MISLVVVAEESFAPFLSDAECKTVATSTGCTTLLPRISTSTLEGASCTSSAPSNFRPTEITGFLGLYQLQFLDYNISKRQTNYSIIEEIIKHNDDLILLKHDHINLLSTFAIPVVCKTKQLRDKYLSQFSGAGIEIRPMIAGNMQKQPFYKKYVTNLSDLPNTDFLHDNSFPSQAGLNKDNGS